MEATLAIAPPPIEFLKAKAKGAVGRRSCVACHQRISGPVMHICAGTGKGKGPGGVGRKVRLAVAERDGWICQLCGEAVDPRLPGKHPFGASVDHRLPRDAGGKNGRDNLQLAHQLCNILRATTPLETLDREALRERFAVAWTRYLARHPLAEPELAIARIAHQRERRRAARTRRAARRAAARAALLAAALEADLDSPPLPLTS